MDKMGYHPTHPFLSNPGFDGLLSHFVRFPLRANSSDNGKTAAGGMTSIVAGMLFLSVQMWAGPTHIIDSVNYADAFHAKMVVSGALLVILGVGLLGKSIWQKRTVAPKEAIPILQ